MKTQTAKNNTSTPVRPVNRLARAFKNQEESNRAERERVNKHLARCEAIRAAREKEIVGGINVIQEYDYEHLGRFGIAIRKADGKLVSFLIPRSGGMDDIYDGTEVEEITCREALEWIEHFDFADKWFGECFQQGPGYPAWIKMLKNALPVNA